MVNMDKPVDSRGLRTPHAKRNAEGINIEHGLGNTKRFSGTDLPRLKPGSHLDKDSALEARANKVATGSSYVAGIYKKPVSDKDKSSSRWLVYPVTAAFGFVGGIARSYARKNGYEPIEIMPDMNIPFLYSLIIGGGAFIGGKYESECYEGVGPLYGASAGCLTAIVSEAAGELLGSLFFK